MSRRFNGKVAAAVLLLLLVAAGVALVKITGDESGEDGAAIATGDGVVLRPRGNTTLAHVRRFRGFPVYFARPAAAGYPLLAIIREDRTSPAPRTEFTFMYGTCVARPDSACGPPLTIISWPACYRYETRYAIPRKGQITLRGVPARLFGDFPRIELYPVDTTVVINLAGSRAALLRVALALRGVNVRAAAGEELPPRPRHVTKGTVKCRPP